ncbi:phospholipase [Brumimicrobium salinarum]|uniref:Phospholipase n=1 Tax=Brumimicrobium salinarum TaxID=2058658 RepID=A0A2I0R1V4_9FLAO|nr:phospholipase [Brumimicrobium salinarum]PKR80380.1 phospholipase [Brumimicrobium salinarum]
MEHKININKTARFFTFGNQETAENIWIVLHGYAQLPAYFIRKFNTLDPEKNFIVAPEGIHRLYIKGTSGRVGASWMTKEAREDDIQDNHAFLNQLATTLLNKKSYKKRFLLGFSQGGATASRWHNSGNFKANHFILWASVFPEDISFEADENTLNVSDNYFVVGNEDPFFDGKHDEVQQVFAAQNFNIQIKTFDGKHDIQTEMLHEIAQECETK